ncbi:hypothetical protein ACROYT_G014965 [Oculina patagonica]
MSTFGELAIPDVNNAQDSDFHPLALSPVNVLVASATESPSTNLTAALSVTSKLIPEKDNNKMMQWNKTWVIVLVWVQLGILLARIIVTMKNELGCNAFQRVFMEEKAPKIRWYHPSDPDSHRWMYVTMGRLPHLVSRQSSAVDSTVHTKPAKTKKRAISTCPTKIWKKRTLASLIVDEELSVPFKKRKIQQTATKLLDEVRVFCKEKGESISTVLEENCLLSGKVGLDACEVISSVMETVVQEKPSKWLFKSSYLKKCGRRK